MFSKILVANRGEIAIRVMRACREMGIHSVAVYSEADRKGRHVRYADEAFLLGRPPPTESYLVIDRVIDIARRCGAEAIHPGYGFLAESPAFARRVKESGLVFIGPEPETIALLGDKTAARQCMSRAGLPLVPGIQEAVSGADEARALAGDMGYPVLLKAAAGGGGKGMRIVAEASELERLFNLARSEAGSAFGDDRIYLEKYLEEPRHVEIQIVADGRGEVVHLGERECSVQRRHQKVIEESPSPIVDAPMREKMGQAAIMAAKSANYLNAGTVEFLVDKERNFYFLEVNTRLQVEHPVTEMVTGIDLVREQIRIAAGLPLDFTQQDVRWRGSAIECRIYAEDPKRNFMPSIGTIGSYREPGGPGIRVDSGLAEGDEVSLFYDPLIAKLICWGADRPEAIARMKRALDEYVITGVETVIPLHKHTMDHELFVSGQISTHFLDDHMSSLFERAPASVAELEALSVLACAYDHQSQKRGRRFGVRPRESRWKSESRRRTILGS